MLKRRLIPKLQLKASAHGPRQVLVTTRQFGEVFEIGDPVSQARIFQDQAADELIFLDLDASTQNRGPRLELIARAAESIFMPFTVGGGVRSSEDVDALLAHGADKVSLNSAVLADPSLLDRLASRYGSQCIVISIDYRRDPDNGLKVSGCGGRELTNRSPLDWARECQERGAGEILLTSIDHDGERQGLDLDPLAAITSALSIPVIASGGCGLARH